MRPLPPIAVVKILRYLILVQLNTERYFNVFFCLNTLNNNAFSALINTHFINS